MTLLREGKVTSVFKKDSDNISSDWEINLWVKKAILLYFKVINSSLIESDINKYYDKIPQRNMMISNDNIISSNSRFVPGSYIRDGAYIGRGAVIMPSFINVGAYVGDRTLIDTWATVGSLAYIGKNCHISGGTGIGGVLEPLQAKPVIIEDNCFIGARSEIAEGVIVREGAVISMGCFIGASTKIVNRNTGEISYGEIPPYSVIVPGTLQAKNNQSSNVISPSLACVVIVKTVDERTRSKTSINDILREC
ncbi:MAG TPA: 2,3,4,5-tetrahydropyridine-2,6-dicarboxylate N-succinyltransferase [Candidatus Megaira endosymbiont of Hartmannula sinica]|nr:2,3,4,5-tetrahydropyridine-2,6-dicarboxylate N-succinyltransferase [Candidatus Megaera endosymbiont of Hartmannula sinica]